MRTNKAAQSTETRTKVLKGVEQYLVAMRTNYLNWIDKSIRGNINDFDVNFELDCGGRKFLRIWQKTGPVDSAGKVKGGGRSAHAFIVLEDCEVRTIKKTILKLKAGDILKCATWKQPALNFVRGNVIDGNYGQCGWTGAA